MKALRIKTALLSFVVLGMVSSAAYAPAADQKMSPAEAGSHIFKPDELKWTDAPNALPPGAQVAILEGDPMKPGPYTMRLKVPKDYTIPPHWHNSPEHVTVISGTFNLAPGEKIDRSKGTELPAGSFFMLQPKSHHYAWASEETVIQLHGRGPWAINYVNPNDDPRKKK